MRGATQALERLTIKTGPYLKRNAPTILTCVGAAGVAVTSVMAAKATPKAMKRLEEAKREKGEELTKIEKVKVAGPAYIPAVITGAATVSCIFGANFLNKKQQAALASAYAMLDSSFKDYKEKVVEMHGEETDREIRHEIAKDKYHENPQPEKPSGLDVHLFYDQYSNRYFWKTFDEVKEAEYHLNRNFALRGYADLNEFYEFLHLGPTAYGSEVGWSMEAGGAFYGYTWIDFYHELHESDDPDTPSYYTINMPFGPTADFMDY